MTAMRMIMMILMVITMIVKKMSPNVKMLVS